MFFSDTPGAAVGIRGVQNIGSNFPSSTIITFVHFVSLAASASIAFVFHFIFLCFCFSYFFVFLCSYFCCFSAFAFAFFATASNPAVSLLSSAAVDSSVSFVFTFSVVFCNFQFLFLLIQSHK